MSSSRIALNTFSAGVSMLALLAACACSGEKPAQQAPRPPCEPGVPRNAGTPLEAPRQGKTEREVTSRWVPPERPVDGLEAELDDARAAVLELGQVGWSQYREAGARALLAIADVVQALDPSRAQRERISRVGLQAELLRQTGALAAGHAGWIKVGLGTALDALQALYEDDETTARWILVARRAVDGIEDRHMPSFQQGAIQDAFRATVDAFVTASERASGSTPTGNPAGSVSDEARPVGPADVSARPVKD